MGVMIEPGSEAWLRAVSPSKVPSICGVSRWTSAYTCWMRMKGLLAPQATKDIFATGHAFEYALAQLWREENPGWRLSPGEVQYVTDEFGFPAVATLDRRASRGRGRKIVEMKIARNLDDWGDPDLSGACPADYALQVIAQQAFSGLRAPSDLMVMGPFFRAHTYHIDHDEVVAAWMIGECQKFYASLTLAQPPPLDDTVSTYSTVRALHPGIEPGTSVEVPEELVVDLTTTRDHVGKLTRELRGQKTRLLDLMENCQHATVNGVTVATRRPHGRGGVALSMNEA